MNKTPYPMKSIVAATDFSANGELAVLRAAYIAQQRGLILHLLHVVHPLYIYPELMLSFDTHVKDYERLKHANGIDLLDDLANTIRNDFNIPVHTTAHIGRAHIKIADFAAVEAASLIVVGAHDEKNMLDVVIGSTAFKLLNISPCPVLIVRNKDVASYKKVIAAVDLTPTALQVSAFACAVAKNAHIELLHVFDLKQEILSREVGMSNESVQKYRDMALEHIQSELNKLLLTLNDKRISTKIVNGYLPESIADSVKDGNADLAVLGSKGKSVLQEFLLGSVSKATLSRLDCDVLLI